MAHHTQLSLFDAPTFNVFKPLKEAMQSAAKKSGKSVAQIVDMMNDLAGRFGVKLTNGNSEALSKDTMEKWLNPQDTSRFVTLQALPIFCAVAGDSSPMDVLAKPLGFRIIGPEDQELLVWAKNKRVARKSNRIARQIESKWD
ncbi:MAG: hypothetical protein RBT11_01795 [Desulfobacterales bacterium]|jgi:hypothetical protein|nr:hypothetical protein [Desulfobacterales bacterium]